MTIAECIEAEGMIQYRWKLYVPENGAMCLELLQDLHDTALAGHPIRAKTFHDHVSGCNSNEMRKHVDR